MTEKVWRGLRAHRRWEGTKDELLDCVFWLRSALGVVLGLALGVTGGGVLQGWPAFALFALLSTLGAVVYARVFLGGSDVLGDAAGDLLQEGLMPSLGLFFVAWIVAFGAFHP